MSCSKNPNIEYQNPKKEDKELLIFGFWSLDFELI